MPRIRSLSWPMLLAVPAMLAAVPASAARDEVIEGPVPAQVLRVYDGDTLTVKARIWLGQEVETSVRVQGVDTPELRGKCPGEKTRARAARDFVRAWVDGRAVQLRDVAYGKYAGRVVARVTDDAGGDLSHALIAAGHARPYDGGARPGWCP